MEMENLLLLMEATIRGTLEIMRSMGLDTTIGWTEKLTKETGRKTKCTEKASSTGKMARNTKETL